MQLPEALRAALEHEAAQHTLAELRTAHERLSEGYRAGRPLRALDAAERLAYAVARMPATYAACRAAMEQARAQLRGADAVGTITSLLDIGAGTGAMLWAAAEVIPTLARATLLDADAGMVQLGQAIASGTERSVIHDAEWRTGDAVRSALPPSDLVACSYGLGELPPQAAAQVLRSAWQAARNVLLIIEPGTPAGFARIREWRRQLLVLDAHMVAPCPHAAACPIPENDWCHFAQRVERTSLHRRLKGGSLGYEDEKFSYVALSRFPVAPAGARIIRHPEVAPGAIQLSVCAAEGLREIVVTKKEREPFRRARQARWGQVWQVGS